MILFCIGVFFVVSGMVERSVTRFPTSLVGLVLVVIGVMIAYSGVRK